MMTKDLGEIKELAKTMRSTHKAVKYIIYTDGFK